MRKIVPARPRKPAARVSPRHPAPRPLARQAQGGGRWFPAALIGLPLAAFSAIMLLPHGGGGREAEGAVMAPRAADPLRADFALCSGPVRVTCVVDGDTIWYQGEKIRIADLDTPEISRPGCAREAAMGRRATLRLQALLNAGPFTLEPNPEGRDTDPYGRRLLLVTREGESLGDVLVREGLAERWGGQRIAWC